MKLGILISSFFFLSPLIAQESGGNGGGDVSGGGDAIALFGKVKTGKLYWAEAVEHGIQEELSVDLGLYHINERDQYSWIATKVKNATEPFEFTNISLFKEPTPNFDSTRYRYYYEKNHLLKHIVERGNGSWMEDPTQRKYTPGIFGDHVVCDSTYSGDIEVAVGFANKIYEIALHDQVAADALIEAFLNLDWELISGKLRVSKDRPSRLSNDMKWVRVADRTDGIVTLAESGWRFALEGMEPLDTPNKVMGVFYETIASITMGLQGDEDSKRAKLANAFLFMPSNRGECARTSCVKRGLDLIFHNKPSAATTAPTAVDGVVADFNGDGIMDLAKLDTADHSIHVFLGKGNGTFIPGPKLTLKDGEKLTSADVNGDGKMDLIVVGSNSTIVYIGNGDGTFFADNRNEDPPIPSVEEQRPVNPR